MATKKQLAALAKARAARRRGITRRGTTTRRCRITRKRTGFEIDREKIKTSIYNTSKSMWTALKDFSAYLAKTGIKLIKNTSMAAISTIQGQSGRLAYIKLLMNQIMTSLDEMEASPSIEKITKLSKNANMLVALTKLEEEDNKDLPKRFLREVYNVPDEIEKIRKKITVV